MLWFNFNLISHFRFNVLLFIFYIIFVAIKVLRFLWTQISNVQIYIPSKWPNQKWRRNSFVYIIILWFSIRAGEVFRSMYGIIWYYSILSLSLSFCRVLSSDVTMFLLYLIKKHVNISVQRRKINENES